MRILMTFLVLLLITPCFADRVVVKKSTGELIEYQSGNALLGTLTQNAVNYGYNANDVEEKYVNEQEWIEIKEKWIDKLARDSEKIKNDNKNAKKELIKIKLNLSNQEFKDLKEALGL